jgi:hypothetical protein
MRRIGDEAVRRTPCTLADGVHLDTAPEAPGNVTSNLAYAACGLAYLGPLLQGDPTAWIPLVGMMTLALGSALYHAHTRTWTLVADHVGMHLAVGGVAVWSFGCVFALPTTTTFALMAMVVVAFVVALGLYPGAALDTDDSQPLIQVWAALLLVALVAGSLGVAAMTAVVFMSAFKTHDHGHNTPTGFGPTHAEWHRLTALGLVLPILLGVWG